MEDVLRKKKKRDQPSDTEEKPLDITSLVDEKIERRMSDLAKLIESKLNPLIDKVNPAHGVAAVRNNDLTQRLQAIIKRVIDLHHQYGVEMANHHLFQELCNYINGVQVLP